MPLLAAAMNTHCRHGSDISRHAPVLHDAEMPTREPPMIRYRIYYTPDDDITLRYRRPAALFVRALPQPGLPGARHGIRRLSPLIYAMPPFSPRDDAAAESFERGLVRSDDITHCRYDAGHTACCVIYRAKPPPLFLGGSGHIGGAI